MTFRVGQKVAAFKGSLGSIAGIAVSEYSKPAIGEVCTVKTINHWPTGSIITLVEHDNSRLTARFGGFYEPGFKAECFRPLVEDRKRVSFTMGADPDSEKFDNRRNIKVKA